MKAVLIVDLETTGLDRVNDHVIEIGYVLWSVEHRTMFEVYSGLLPCAQNPAEAVNGIPSRALDDASRMDESWAMFSGAAAHADAIVAHQADFDRDFCRGASGDYAEDVRAVCEEKPWICTREDVTWPRAATGTSLIAVALAHGVAVVAPHRAVNDCLTMVRLFEAVPDIADRLEAGLIHANLPKVRLVSLAPYEEREVVKANGFKWAPERKEWWRVMAVEDAQRLPFRTRTVPL